MSPRQDIVIQPQVIRVEQTRPPPPPPPGRFQRPPHDHPAVYVRTTPRATNVVNTRWNAKRDSIIVKSNVM